MFGRQAVSSETICNRIREEIIPILYQVVRNDEIMFHNPHIVHCWEKKGCEKRDCVAHGHTDVPCWYRAGTYCCGTIQGEFVDKCGGCRQCDVFKESCPTLCDRAFRYGGEEFVVILSGTDMTMAWILAERIRKTCEKEPIVVETKDGVEKTIFQTMSIGLAAYRKGMTHCALLEQADAAVYMAKSEGKNKVNRFGID